MRKLLFYVLWPVLAAGALYYYGLLLASLFSRGKRASHRADVARAHRFAIVIPAHNEGLVIGRTVRQLAEMQYDRRQFDIHVVADFCTDVTAEQARVAGAIVHERTQGPRGRKGHALAWILARLLAGPDRYDAIAVFDADSLVDPAFLKAVAPLLAAGAAAVQGQHRILNPHDSRFATLADADMRLNNRIRNQAKEALGLSARLMGDGMVFRTDLLRQHPWGEAGSLIEDRAYGMQLVLAGARIRYAASAVSYGQAAGQWQVASKQRLRWYGGVFDLQRRYTLRLLRAAWSRRSVDALDRAVELLAPSFSSLSVASASGLVLSALLASLGLLPAAFVRVSAGMAAFLLAYPFIGLLIDRAPLRSFSALAIGPFYAMWRVGIGLQARLRADSTPWIRTSRREESHPQR